VPRSYGPQSGPNRYSTYKGVLQLHKELYKAESTLLVQSRTGRIGLARFLYTRKVPGIASAQCQCRAGEETPRHMALFCNHEANRRHQLMDPEGKTNRSINRPNISKGTRQNCSHVPRRKHLQTRDISRTSLLKHRDMPSLPLRACSPHTSLNITPKLKAWPHFLLFSGTSRGSRYVAPNTPLA
jgi:hypothetical protein